MKLDLNKLKEQLDNGSVDQNTVEHLKAIQEKADGLDGKQAQDLYQKRVDESYVEPLKIDDEEMKKYNEEQEKAIEEIKKEEELLQHLSVIVNYENNLDGIKKEYEEAISEMEINLSQLLKEFKEKFGDVEEHKKKYNI